MAGLENPSVYQFQQRLQQLGGHPDREAIKSMRDLARDAKSDLVASTAIVDTVMTMLRSAAADDKVAVLYTLDAILKAVGQPYISLSAKNIVGTLAAIMPDLPPAQEARVVRTAKTWLPFKIFPPTIIDAIVRAANANANARQGSAVGAAPPPPVPQHSLLSGMGVTAPPAAKRARVDAGPPAADPYVHPVPAIPPPAPALPLGVGPPPSYPEYDAHPLTSVAKGALRSLPPLGSAQEQVNFSSVTTALARADPGVSEAVTLEITAVQRELGGHPPLPHRPPVDNYAAYLVDTLMHHQQVQQALAQQAAAMAAVSAGATAGAGARHQGGAGESPRAFGPLTPSEAANRNDVLDGWRVTALPRGALTALTTGRPHVSRRDLARFTSPDALQAHTAWLDKRERSKGVRGVVSQPWMHPPSTWIHCAPWEEEEGEGEPVSFFAREAAAKAAAAEAASAAEMVAREAYGGGQEEEGEELIPVDPRATSCPLSGEDFKKRWDGPSQQWVYVGVVRRGGVLYDAQAAAEEDWGARESGGGAQTAVAVPQAAPVTLPPPRGDPVPVPMVASAQAQGGDSPILSQVQTWADNGSVASDVDIASVAST